MPRRRHHRTRGTRLGACLTAVREPAVRRIVVSSIGFGLVENVTWTATLVYAYRQGGADEVGLVGFAALVPGIVVAPLASYAGDRFHRVRVLVASYAIIAVACVTVAVMIGGGANRFAVYAIAAAAATAITFPRPAMGALLPSTVGSGDQLTAANVSLGVALSLSLFGGPVLAGLLLLVADVAALFWCSALLAAASAVIVAPVPLRRSPLTDEERMTVQDVRAETIAGIKLLRSEPAPRIILVVLGLQTFMVGFLDVAAVVVALDVLDRSEAFAGWLSAAIGAGAIGGAVLAMGLIGRRRIAPSLLGATVLAAGPLVIMAVTTDLVPTFTVFVLCGLGIAWGDVAGQTLLQRVTPDEMMARVYGCLEGYQMATIAAGSLVCSLLFGFLDVGPVVLAAAAGVGVVVLAIASTLLSIDRDRMPPDPELVELLRATPFLAPLPAHSLERVCHAMTRIEPTPGERIVAYGTRGTTMYIIAAGTVRVMRDGEVINRCGPTDHFGELALLDGSPRSADVVADDGLVLYEMELDTFVFATTGHPRAAQRLQHVADTRRGQ